MRPVAGAPDGRPVARNVYGIWGWEEKRGMAMPSSTMLAVALSVASLSLWSSSLGYCFPRWPRLSAGASSRRCAKPDRSVCANILSDLSGFAHLRVKYLESALWYPMCIPRQCVLAVWLHALWKVPAALSILDTAALAVRDWRTIDAHAASLLQVIFIQAQLRQPGFVFEL